MACRAVVRAAVGCALADSFGFGGGGWDAGLESGERPGAPPLVGEDEELNESAHGGTTLPRGSWAYAGGGWKGGPTLVGEDRAGPPALRTAASIGEYGPQGCWLAGTSFGVGSGLPSPTRPDRGRAPTVAMRGVLEANLGTEVADVNLRTISSFPLLCAFRT